MDLASFIGTLQLLLGALQLQAARAGLRGANRERDPREIADFEVAIREIEIALAQTLNHLRRNQDRPNDQLAVSWEAASKALRRIPGGGGFAGMTFQKSLFWRNPQLFRELAAEEAANITIENVLKELRKVRSKLEKARDKAA